mmetsp:Transcript_15148/g.36979  ORF Transcript_15148/g.36979 Transcript_15148/m.36979 type:complete len:223 (-) Transcript_15148:647-1315(-)
MMRSRISPSRNSDTLNGSEPPVSTSSTTPRTRLWRNVCHSYLKRRLRTAGSTRSSTIRALTAGSLSRTSSCTTSRILSLLLPRGGSSVPVVFVMGAMGGGSRRTTTSRSRRRASSEMTGWVSPGARAPLVQCRTSSTSTVRPCWSVEAVPSSVRSRRAETDAGARRSAAKRDWCVESEADCQCSDCDRLLTKLTSAIDALACTSLSRSWLSLPMSCSTRPIL